MPRDIPLGNGRLLCAFDRSYALRDLCWPHAGQENHGLGRRSRLALRVDGKVRWVGDPDFPVDLAYEPGTLVSRVAAHAADLGIAFHATDAVHPILPILVRRFVLRELAGRERGVRLYLHHDFDVLESDSGITATYDAPLQAILHYKRRRYFLIGLDTAAESGVRAFSCDHRIARDGRGAGGQAELGMDLDRNPIALGAVDSVVATDLLLPAHGSAEAATWIAVGHRYQDVAELQALLRRRSPAALVDEARHFWRQIVRAESSPLARLHDDDRRAAETSLLVVRTNCDADGGILAATDTDNLDPGREHYAYVWMRDGAFVADALDQAGDAAPARRFFEFCARHLGARDCFLHRYHADGSLGSSWHPTWKDGQPVLPIQEDETALVLWALARHLRRRPDPELAADLYTRVVARAANFLASWRDETTGLPHPSWDLWEERHGVHAFTVAAVVAGLRGAADLATLAGRPEEATGYLDAASAVDAALDHYLFHRDLGRYARTGYREGSGYWLDTTPDASLLGLFLLGVRSPSEIRMAATATVIGAQLSVPGPIGGVARYLGDRFCRPEAELTPDVPGNPWIVCTLWYAEWLAASATDESQVRSAEERLAWARARALPSGIMAEQFHPVTGAPLSVSPLTWSHAAYLSASLRIAARRREFR